MRIAINGAGIAGPTLAYWLAEAGHEVVLVEHASHLRSGGYVVDFWGVGFDIAEKMGLMPRVMEQGYAVKEVRLVDAKGRRCGGFPVEVFRRLTSSRFTSVRRSDLSATIYAAIAGRVETIFGDSIAALDEHARGVRVQFDRGESREVDLVVGADGLHSRIRKLAFGPDATFEVPLGYHVAAFETVGYRPREDLVYVSHAVPGRQVSRFSMRDDRTLFLFVFSDEYVGAETPNDANAQKRTLRRAFGGAGWECGRILEALDDAQELYFDRVSQIRMQKWTKRRTALVGDAAACVSLLAGEGTGLAMAEAYVLATEINRRGDDYTDAFARYERLMMPFLAKKQQAAAKFASSFAPRTRIGIAFRNVVTGLLRIPAVADFFVGRSLRDDIVLPDYRSNASSQRSSISPEDG
jgi:2-polyprenyl-6-methoxyphenol hydroxylase-like FAD-dependent oxidoreductase